MNYDNDKFDKVEMENGDILLKKKKVECLFKVGDWVTVISHKFNNTMEFEVGETFCVVENKQSELCKGWLKKDNSGSAAAVDDCRQATQEEILSKIAKYEVGEEVWCEARGGFYKVTNRHLTACKVYYSLERSDTRQGYEYPYVSEALLEKRPRPKFKKGDMVVEKAFREDGALEVVRVEWDGETWKYYYGDRSFDYEADLELYVEPKREPKSGEVWTTTNNIGKRNQDFILVGSTSYWLPVNGYAPCVYYGDVAEGREYLCDFKDFEPKK